MNYYQFHIGDYKSHTAHLDPLEDIAYRRMLDWYYLHEKPLPKTKEEIARLINMRTHCDCIANVLREFFQYDKNAQAWRNKRADELIDFYLEKSEKARKSAEARWNGKNSDANALRTECEGNANHKPITNNHKPETNNNIYVANATCENASVSPVPFDKIIGKWNELADDLGLPKTVKKTKTLEGQLRQRWKQDMPTLEQWGNFFDYIQQSKFLTGRTKPNGERPPFRCTLHWATKETNFAKIAAGEYH